MRGMTEQFVVERTEEGDKEKKKKRRTNRRNKHNSSVSGAGHSAVNGVHGEASACLRNGNTSNYGTISMNSSSSQTCGLNFHVSNDRGLARASDVAFSSLPTMRINDQVAEFSSMQDQSQFPSNLEGTVFSKSCPVPIIHEETNELSRGEEFVSPHKNVIPAGKQKKFFVPHWSAQAVDEAIEKGEVLKASFRVNAYNPAEAYCSIDGVPIDILIHGVLAQNRAVEGDTVAVKLDPLAYWTRLKGSAGHVNSSALTDDSKMSHEVVEVVGKNCKGKEKLGPDCDCGFNKNDMLPAEMGFHNEDRSSTGVVHPEQGIVFGSYKVGSEGHHSSSSDLLNVGNAPVYKEASNAIEKICAMVNSYPLKRPTGRVVAIVDRSPRRDSIVGFLGVKQWLSHRDGYKRETKKNGSSIPVADRDNIQLIPNDAKFPKMLVSVRSLQDCIKKRLEKGDATVDMELVAARIDDWSEASPLPRAQVVHVLGRGGEIGSQIAGILFENAICSSDFSPESLSCLPDLPWEVPIEEVERRKDLRNLCTFTIDPSTAIDIDDALSVERISEDIFRVGIHIADVSYFVLPGTALDIEAQIRSTSVYLRQQKLPMLPPLLSEDLGSLIPGVDKLAFSIICDINLAGDVVDRWLGHTVIRSCCKLSYQHAQDIIDGLAEDADKLSNSGNGYPKLYGQFEWQHITRSIKSLHEISKRLKENRCKDGSLCLDSSKLVFSFDECGIPLDSMFFERTDSNSLVEELMILANRTAAEVISRAFPDSALLRRHPEPNLRKLREFEAFCQKHGLEVDTSSGQLQLSLERIKAKLKNDPVLFDILVSYSSKPMQLAAYFCTGDLKDRRSDWTHYSLGISHYTHFTSPLRRYPDIVVHRTLAAAIEAEDLYLQHHRTTAEVNKGEAARKCFTGIYFDEDTVDTKECREALSASALKHRVLCAEVLTEVAAYCNKRTMASKHAEDACDKLYLWAMLRKKQTLVTEARVLGLGPKFMSIYIHKLAIERRIYYDEVDGLMTEWLETTSTLVLNLCTNKHSQRRSSPGNRYRPLEDVAWIISPCDLNQEEVVFENTKHEDGRVQLAEDTATKPNDPEVSDANEIEPAFFPLTVCLLSTINVALHAVGGDDGPLDIGARLYLSSYLR